MVAGAEIFHQNIPVLDVQYRCSNPKGSDFQKIEQIVGVSPPPSPAFCQIRASESEFSAPEVDVGGHVALSDASLESAISQFVPVIRSGSFADIGPRRFMEDEHIRIDNLSFYLGSFFRCPTPSAFYGLFDGHGGTDAATYIKKNAFRFFFEDPGFPQAFEVDEAFLVELENSVRNAFLQADLALAADCTVSSSSGTTALTALIFGRLLLVANAGDCRAVLCRKGEAVDMSQDHKPDHAAERKRIEEFGGFVDDGGYLNGVLSLARALGDWDVKLPLGSSSPLIAEPEFKRVTLTDDDEFLIIGCDGIWDVMSSQHAVSIVRRSLRRHDNPEQCARELVLEALRLNTSDNLTVIVVCFSTDRDGDLPSHEVSKLRCCSLSAGAISSLKTLLEDKCKQR